MHLTLISQTINWSFLLAGGAGRRDDGEGEGGIISSIKAEQGNRVVREKEMVDLAAKQKRKNSQLPPSTLTSISSHLPYETPFKLHGTFYRSCFTVGKRARRQIKRPYLVECTGCSFPCTALHPRLDIGLSCSAGDAGVEGGKK